VTSIQKLLGHKRLESTIVYARVYDRTVADDYYAAMAKIEGSLATPGTDAAPVDDHVIPDDERAYLLDLTNRLAEPQLSVQHRLELVESMRGVLVTIAKDREVLSTIRLPSETWMEVAAATEVW
jgi:hypothetical protein